MLGKAFFRRKLTNRELGAVIKDGAEKTEQFSHEPLVATTVQDVSGLGKGARQRRGILDSGKMKDLDELVRVTLAQELDINVFRVASLDEKPTKNLKGCAHVASGHGSDEKLAEHAQRSHGQTRNRFPRARALQDRKVWVTREKNWKN